MQLLIQDINHQGEGVARYHGKVIFIPFALPGEEVEAEIIKDRKKYAYAVLKRIINVSPDRIAPKCPYYFQCGGCSYQHVKYLVQVSYKKSTVKQNINRIGKIDVPVNNVIKMKNPWHYRNKVIWHLEKTAQGIKMGYYRKSSHQVINIQNCPLLKRKIIKISQCIRNLSQYIYFNKNASILVRQFSQNNCIMIHFRNCFVAKEAVKQLSRISNSIYITRDQRTELIHGTHVLTEKTDHLVYHMGPHDFFQINPQQTVVLLQCILSYFGHGQDEDILDAYSGVGVFSLNIAKQVNTVTGIEINAFAVKNARVNARLNGIENCTFLTGACEKVLPQLHQKYDRVIIDPPRSGLKKEVITAIDLAGSRTVVYVSCNPATLARDLAIFSSLGYQIEEVQPIDMFPQTRHIEVVTLLSKTK